MKRMRTTQAVEILWHNIFDDDPSSHLTSRALDALAEKERSHYATPEVFAGRFYHFARAAYRGIYFLDDPSPIEMQQILRAEAHQILSCIIADIDTISDGGMFPNDKLARGLMLYGQANEFTPIVIGNATEAVITLASRDDDKKHRTDLVANYFDTDEMVPIQMKTNGDVKSAHAPNEGIVIVASDFGNEYLRASRAALNPGDPESNLTLTITSELFNDTLSRRKSSKEEHDRELEELRAEYKIRARKLTQCIGDIAPELNELRKQLGIVQQVA